MLETKRPDPFGTLIFATLAAAFIFFSQAYLQNVHLTTTNGLWKSMGIQDFMDNPSWGNLPTANILLHPLHAAFGWMYDLFGIHSNTRWRQMAVTNGVFGIVGAAFIYYFVFLWTQQRLASFLIASAYCFAGHYILHSITNEDIMPAFVFMMIATLIASEKFTAPHYRDIALVAVLLSFGWMLEWRIIFPILPPLCLALLLSAGSLSQRALRLALLGATILVVPAVIAFLSWATGYRTVAQAMEFLCTLVWTGKAVGTGWGGFTLNKLILLPVGIGEAVFAGRYFTDPQWYVGPYRYSIFLGILLTSTMVVVGLIYSWRSRFDASVRTKFIIFCGLFVAGGVFNLYVQPTDPQFQLNVMLAALPGWVLLICGLLKVGRQATRPVQRSAVRALIATLLLLPISWTYYYFNLRAGGDAIKTSYVRGVSAQFDLTETVFLFHGFEGEITWFVLEHGSATPNAFNIEQFPANTPTFKWLSYAEPAISRPQFTGTEHADLVMAWIDHALDLGYRVLTPDTWGATRVHWVHHFVQIADKDKALAIRTAFHNAYAYSLVFRSSSGPDLVEITRR